MPAPPTISQPSVAEVPPIIHDGVRYEQGKHDDRAGDQRGGYLVAIDVASGKLLWRLQVYAVTAPPPGVPALARDFRSMQLEPDGKSLRIENDAGGVYRVELATHASVQVGGPPESTPPAAPGKPKPQPGG